MLMLVSALLMFWGLAKLLSSLFVEVEDEEEAGEPSTTGETPGGGA
jgi:hypothetical protein